MSRLPTAPEQGFDFTALPLTSLRDGIELGVLEHCDIFNVSDVDLFLHKSVLALAEETDGCFTESQSEAEKSHSSVAEFVTWYLFVKCLNEFAEKYARSGQNNHWLAPGSPNFIDIIALRKVGSSWRFYAIEVKWSQNCDYYRQVRGGLVADLQKLHRIDVASTRLGTHITGLKAQLTPHLGKKAIEAIFSGIKAGATPKECMGIEYWGVFVSDWSRDTRKHNPDNHFAKLREEAEASCWPEGMVKGFMINIPNACEFLTDLAMGKDEAGNA